MLYQNARPWLLPKALNLLLFFLFFSAPAYAKNDLVVSDVCAPRALEMNIFSTNGRPVTDLSEVKKRLREKVVGNQNINFQNLANHYNQTLQEMNRQLKDYKSPLFQYLLNCRRDSAACHGYFNFFKNANSKPIFNPKTAAALYPGNKYQHEFFKNKIGNLEVLSEDEKFRRNIYCDREIYRSIVGEVMQTNQYQYEQCVEAPFLAEIGYAEELSKSRDIHTCYYKTSIDGQTYLKNRYPEFMKKYNVASYWYDKAPDLSLKAIQQSFLPLGFLFIIRKSFEEFQQDAKLSSKLTELNQYYGKLRVAKVFSDFDASLYLPEQQQSQKKVNNQALKFFNSLDPKKTSDGKTILPDQLIFDTEDFFTLIVFAEAERQHWIDRLQFNSPLLDPMERLEYFKYLNRNPYFFYDQSSTFNDFVKNPSLYKTHIPTQDPPPPDLAVKVANNLGYRQFKTYEPYGPLREYQPGTQPKVKPVKPGSNQINIQQMIEQDRMRSQDKKTTAQFVFDEIFNETYLAKLIKEKNRREEMDLEDVQEKWQMYELMFHKVKLYQFNRLTQARVYREIQKRAKSSFRSENPLEDPYALDNPTKFHSWVDKLICRGSTKKYCSKEHENFRKDKHEALFNKITNIDEEKNIQYASGEGKRAYIYDQKFLDMINKKIKTVNQFCYNNATDGEYIKSPDKYNEIIDEEMKTFYSLARLDDLLNQSGSKFAEVFQYKADRYALDCFTKGRVFGGSYYTNKVIDQIKSVASAGPGAQPARGEDGGLDTYTSGLKVHDAYLPSSFQVTLEGLHSIEDHIENTIDSEFENLDEIYDYKNLGNYESFLKESAASRIGAMLDYIADGPNEKIAKYICHLIKISDADEFQDQKNRETAGTIAIILASIPTFYMPAIFAGTISLYRAGTALLVTAASVGSATYKIHYYKHKIDQANIAGVTNSMGFTDAQLVHKLYRDNSVAAKNTILVDFGMLVVFSGGAIYAARNEIKDFFSISVHEEQKRRLLAITEITRNTGGKIKLVLSRQVQSFIINKNKMSTLEFYDGFMKKLMSGGVPAAEKYLIEKYGKEIGKYVEMDMFKRRTKELKELLKDPQSNAKLKYSDEILQFLGSPKVSEYKWTQFKLAFFNGPEASDHFLMKNWKKEMTPLLLKQTSTIWQDTRALFLKIPYVKKSLDAFTTGALYTKTYFNKWVFDLKTHIWSIFRLDAEKWYVYYPYKLLAKEKWLIRIIHEAQVLETKTGHQIFTRADIEKFASKMKNFFLDEHGYFQPYYDKEMAIAYDHFLTHVINGSRPEVEKYLAPLIGGELLKGDWINVLNGFVEAKVTISSVREAKAFLKSIKYAAKQYSTLASQSHNIGELMKWQEFFGTYVYINRSKVIISKMVEIYEVAKYVNYKNDIKFVLYFGEYFTRNNTSTADIENQIKKFDPDFQYAEKLENLGNATKFVGNFEKNHPDYFEMVADANGKLTYALKKVTGKNDLFKYEKDFIAQEERYREDFHKELTRYFKKMDNPVKAYEKALEKIQQRKMIEFECSLPQSYHKENINRLYRKTTATISAGASLMGYLSAHMSEEKNPEWWSRFTYEVSMSIFSGYIMSKVFTNKDGAPLYIVSHEFRNGLALSLVDAGIYSVVNDYWSTDEKVKGDFAKMIYQSDNLRETINEFFKAYPDYADQVIERLEKIERFIDEVNVKLSKGTLVDSDIENDAIKRGLVEDLTDEQGNLIKEKLMKNPLYKKAIEEGYMDDSMFEKAATDHDRQNQFSDRLAKIKYDEAFEHKSGEIKLPLLPKWDIGTIDWVEMKTGSETLDRLLYYPIFYDIPKTPVNYLKNRAIFNVLCNGYWKLPGRTSELAAIAINAAYKSALEPYKFYMREQVTGH